VDVLVTNNGGPARLLLNENSGGSPWLQVRLEATIDNRQGLGARVGVRRTDGTILWRRARTDGSYLSASDSRVHFGLGAASEVEGILVEWPRGGREVWTGITPNRIISLRQGTGARLDGEQEKVGRE
jgi:hypothetical protein